MILLNPSLILIDHGHFQYNCISLGLTVAAVAAILSDRDVIGSVLFSFALNHKQMSAYFAPSFFSYLLGKCLRQERPFLKLVKLGLLVVGTFAIVWNPYLHSAEAFLEVLFRLAPLERGIYEDYVANFWCATSVIIKWKRLFAVQPLKLLSLAATVSTCLPSMIQLILAPRKSSFLYGLLNGALAFYLFSFQVHEKSILLPLLPASLTQNGLISMFPLLVRDKLVLPYVALYGLFVLIYYAPSGRQRRRETRNLTLKVLLLGFFAALHVVYLTVAPPRRYPFLFEAIIMLIWFSQFVLIFIHANSKQWTLSKLSTSSTPMKKHL